MAKSSNPPVEGKGTLFPSKKKANPKSPDWYGEFMHNGEIIKLSGWHRRGEGQYGAWELIGLAVDTYGQKDYKPRDITPNRGDSDIPF